MKCPICNSKKIDKYKKLPTIYTHDKLIKNIKYGFCNKCTIIFNRDIFTNKEKYQRLFFKYIQKELFLDNNSKIELNNRLDDYISIAKTIDSNEINSILDIGCRDGKLLHELGNILNTNELVGVDFKVHKDYSNIKYFEGDFLDFNITQKFDLVISTHVIEHLLYPLKFFKKVDLLLENSKYLLLSFPDAFYEFSNNIFGTETLNIDHKLHFSLETMKYLCNKFGYDILFYNSSFYKSEYKYSVSLNILIKKEKRKKKFFLKTKPIKSAFFKYHNTYLNYLSYIKNLSKEGEIYLYGSGQAGQLFNKLFSNHKITLAGIIDDFSEEPGRISFEDFKNRKSDKQAFLLITILKKNIFEKIVDKVIKEELENIKVIDLFWGVPFYVQEH
ncbi:class I SAM-dependent methyltransferase [Halarcobacter bivalviorum]|uniref:SAM-dependent methyltransferase n=1 Tax=Halarcobacter bivalviorum TaxID=663364 RepID=A0AAX2AB99_9BACT|nr:class I SAM-dependent methyltransferase [Halarcobacter bivalviorum]AXH13451.1 SAM-dependent methyltransferase [Halarcobacter bivalviorum]RXK09951.1 hypothetical protein CRV05_06095 [Halarcobacter bivalviorum]